MAYYPLFLELKGRPCLVVGGGQVAARKVEGLLAAGARCHRRQPCARPRSGEAAQVGEADRPRRQAISARSISRDTTVVIAATDDAATNERVAADARAGRRPRQRCRRAGALRFHRARPSSGAATSCWRYRRAASARRWPAGCGRSWNRISRRISSVWRSCWPRCAASCASAASRVEPEAWQGAIDGGLRDLSSAGRHAEARSRLLSALGVEKQLPT